MIERSTEHAVPVVEERVEAGTLARDTGRGVRVHTHVTEREAFIDAPLREDELVIERVVVDRLVEGEPPRPHAEGDTWIVPVLEEIVVVERRVRLKEEVRITRRARERHEVQRVRLRAEDVSVEPFDESTPGGRHG